MKGELSVFLVLILAVIIPLILTMIEASRISVMKLQLESVTDVGMDSILAEYNRPLLEQYGLLFIDLSYGEPTGSLENLKDHFEDYVMHNLKPESDLSLYGYRDFTNLRLSNIDVLSASRATDEGGALFRYMAVSYMLDRYGISYIADMQDLVTSSEAGEIFSSNIMEEMDSNRGAIDGIEISPPEDLEEGEEWVEPERDNPTQEVEGVRNQGILSLVCQEEISTISFLPENYVSERNLVVGNGMEPDWTICEPIVENLLFNEYIMEKCGNYKNLKEGSYLQYQTEYIIAGQSNDTDNLRVVAERLLLIRGGANALYFFSHQELVNQARALASSLSFILAFPEFEPLFEAAISLAWIYAESVMDVKTLFDGGRVPLLKGTGDWNLSLENALSLSVEMIRNSGRQEESNTGHADENGLSYEDYLRILLYLTDTAAKTERCMNVVEMDIRQVPGYEYFCLDQCVASLQLQLIYESGYGYTFLMQRKCHYN